MGCVERQIINGQKIPGWERVHVRRPEPVHFSYVISLQAAHNIDGINAVSALLCNPCSQNKWWQCSENSFYPVLFLFWDGPIEGNNMLDITFLQRGLL